MTYIEVKNTILASLHLVNKSERSLSKLQCKNGLDFRYSETAEQLIIRKTFFFFWLEYVFLGNLEELIPELLTKFSQLIVCNCTLTIFIFTIFFFSDF